MESDLNKKIIELLTKIIPYEEITSATELIDNGILDSLSIMLFVTKLEDEFEVEIPDDAITAENFSNVWKIARLVEDNNTL